MNAKTRPSDDQWVAANGTQEAKIRRQALISFDALLSLTPPAVRIAVSRAFIEIVVRRRPFNLEERKKVAEMLYRAADQLASGTTDAK